MIRRLWPILFLVLLPQLFQAQTPTRGVSAGEYFWDTDPGLGNGTAFFATDGTFDETVEALLATGITTPSGNGPHLFSVRIQDVDGQWGTLFTTVVENFVLTNSHRNLAVATAEFFWDVDPGQGNGTALLALDGNLNEAVEALFENGITVPSSAGAHLFNVRVQDIDGGWSPVFTTALYNDPAGSTLRNPEVIQAEYYWDTDPGLGLGDPLLAFDGALDEAVEALLNTGIIVPAGLGPHTFSVRVLDADYQWSTIFTTTVYRDTLTQAVRPLQIAMAEFYWDVDPGVGLANPILAADGAFDESVEALLHNGVIMPSTNGPHTFNLRVKDAQGVWGQTFTTTLHRDSVIVGTRPARVVAGEYFWDVDPGQGFANAFVALDGNFNETVEAMLDAAVILPSINGAHTFNVRAKGSNGAWGPLFTTQVYRDSVTTQTRPLRVAAAEYFWNADPGQGAGTPMAATDGTFDEILEGLENNAIPIAGLPAGANLLSVRAQDPNGDWGPVFSMVVVTSSPTFRQDTILGQVAFCGQVPATAVTYTTDTLGGNTYTWTALNGTIVSGQGGETVQVLWNSTGPWELTVEGCNPQTLCDTLFLIIDTLPLPTVNAGVDVSICPSGNTALLATTTTPPVTYAWTPSTGLSNTTIANPVANPSVTTLYTVTATDTNGCQQSDDVQVTVNPPATAFAGNDTVICRGSSAQLNAIGGVSYAWSPGTGLSSTTIANPVASPLATTTYTVTVTDLNGCTASDAVVVTVSNGPNVDAGPNAAICIGDTAQLNATGALTYAWSPGGTLSTTNIPNPQAFPLVTTQYYVTGTDVYGCARTDSMTLTVNPLPTVNASADVARCLGQSVTITATGATSYIWTPSTGLSNPNIASPVATPTVTTLYTVLGTNANGCQDTADVLVTINPLPNVSAGPDDTICAADTLQLLATGAVTYAWSPSTGLSATNIPNPTTVPPFSITYTVTGTDGNGCVASDQIEVTVEVCVSNTIARNILQAEYFWDVDPGQGLATPIAAADGTFDETVEALLESAVNMPTSQGAHAFNIRVMDRQNNWGPLFTTLVFRDTLTPGNRTIGVQMAEYYWDADPGQGNGTPMIAFDGSYGGSVEAVLAPTANVPTNGTHLFSVRIQDSEGNWSAPFSTVIRYDSVVVPTRTVAVQMAEYFWDVDPGQGLGIPMLALDGNLDEAVEALLESGATVPAGYGAHSFGVRVRDDQNGGWSTVFTTMVFRDSIEITHRDFKVVQAEYFWDVDPGQGSGLPMLALDGNLDEAAEALLNNPLTVPAAYGPHTLGIRVKDVDGVWGSLFSMMVVRDTIQTTTRPIRLTQAEYFWDTDPGQGNGTPLLAVDGAIDEIIEAFLNNPVNVPTIVGPHVFHVRVRDVNNNWGPLFRTVVHHDSVTVGTRTLMVTQAEYFWDTDPGQGNGTPMLAFDGNLDEMVESVFANGIQVPLPIGAHRFRVRVKDFNGIWSSVFTMMVDRDTITPIARDIHLTQAEYFWNTDPGQGNGTPMLALDGAIDETVEKLTRSINVQSLLPGPNVLGVRVKDLNGGWSNPFRIVLVIDSVLVTVPEEVVGNLHFCNQISATPEGYSIDTVGTQTYTWFVTGGNLLNGQGGDSITVQWNPTGPYMLKVLVCGNGICDTTYQQVLVTPNPTIVATPDTAYICAGQAVQLVATGGVAFIWSPSIGLNDDDIPNPFASPVVPTQYIVRGTDNYGCHGFDTVFVDINSGGTVNAGPDTTICLGDSVQLNVAGGGLSYAWSPSTGLSNPNIANPMAAPSVTTTYTVLVQTGGSCPATDQVTVYVDNLPPTITCPANITVSNDPGICGAIVNWTAPVGTDNCVGAITTQYVGPTPGSLFAIGNTLIGYEVTDGQGLRDSCQFTVSVVSPEINITGNSLTINDGDLTPSTLDGTDFGIPLPGVPVVHTFTLENNSTVPLTISNISLAGAGAGSFTVGGISLPTVIAAGGSTTFTVTFLSSITGVYNATVIVDNNDCDEGSYDFAVTGEVSCQPAAFTTCPANQVVFTDANQCDAVVNYSATYIGIPTATVTYTFSGATIGSGIGNGSGAVFGLGTTSVELIATNACGADTCNFTITVNDSTAPVITCPANISVNNDPGQCAAVVTYALPTATDNCSGVTVVQTAGQASGTAFPVGFTFNSFDAVDGSGNTQTCFFTVSVSDNEGPSMANCPSNITVNADPNICGAIVTWSGPNFVDNCAGLGISNNHVSGDTFGIGVNSVIYFAIDNNFLTNYCMFTVTVVDSIDPQIVCPSPISVINDPGQCGAVVNYSLPVATDNCLGYTTTLLNGLGSGGNFPVGIFTEVWTVSDVAGNIDTCYFNITVLDQEAPSITCPSNMIVPTALGECKENVIYVVPVGTDNCIGATTLLLSGQGSGGTFNLGTYTEVYVVTDQVGLSDTCSFTITVEDQELPIVTCPANISVIKDPGQNYAVVNYTAPTATDNCPGVTLIQSQGLVSGSQFPIGLTANVFVATDAAGNMDSCLFYVQVVDSSDVIPPTITCPSNRVVNNDLGICGAAVTFIAPIGTDNLPGASTVQNAGLPSGATFPVGTTLQTFVVTDVAGNQDSCSFTVTVLDNESPNAVCQPIIVYLDSTGNYTLSGTEVDNGSTDNCGIASLTLSQSQFDCNDMGGGNSPTDLFISEYIEGNAQNKCLEIYNGTGFPVDLAAAGYSIRVYFNGATTYTDFPLSGVVANGDVFVFCKDNASNTFTSQADQLTNLALWTGDDAIALTKSGQLLDIFGRIGEDPGSGWNDNGKVTINRTLVRKNTVITGVSTNPSFGFPTLDAEWEEWATDFAGNLGTHNLAPTSPTSVTLTVTDPSGNTAQCVAPLVVRDSIAPEVACQSVTVMLDAYGQATLTPLMVSPVLQDNCSLDSAFLDISQFNCNNVGGGGSTANDLFISEYIEGVANTKCLEIFNGTGAPVDLAAGNYAIRIYFNGSTSYTEHLLSGVVANGDVFVFCHRNAKNDALAQSDLLSQTQLWTGDDAIELVHNGMTLDIFGRIGEDPGSAWSMSGNLTINQTLVRNANINSGVTVNPSAGFPTLASEWTPLPLDDVSNLGTHNFVPPPTGNMVQLTAVDNSGNISSCTANVTVLANCQPRFDTCPADIVVTCPLTNGTSAVVTWNTPVAEVNCSALCSLSVVQIAGPPSGSNFTAGTTTTITYVATSGSHTDTCSFNVIVPICPPLRAEAGDGGGVGELGQAALTPTETMLEKPVVVFPNPFRETVTFRFKVEEPTEVEMVITDLNGRILRRYHADQMDAGVQHWIWDATEDSGTPVTGGIYLYRLRMGDRVEFGKVEYVR